MNEKTKLLVIFEDGKEPLEAIAKTIKASLSDTVSVKARSASEVAVAELLAADAYAFGVADAASPAWAELKRLLTGMNLAGRRAGFFVVAKGAAERLKAAFEPAELSSAGPDLVADPSCAVADWAGSIVAAK